MNTKVIAVLQQLHTRESSVLQMLLENAYKMVKGITQLQQRLLPIELVSPDHLEVILTEIDAVLTKNFPKFCIMFPTPRQYYDTSLNLVYTSTRRYLYIKIQIPLADNSMIFDVYDIHTIPLTLSHDSHQFSRLTNIPDFLGVSQDKNFFVELTTAQFQTCTSASLMQCHEVLPLIKRQDMTCTAALFLDVGYQRIQQLCDLALYPHINKSLSYFLHTSPNIGTPTMTPTFPRQIYSPRLRPRPEEDDPSAGLEDLKLFFHSSSESSLSPDAPEPVASSSTLSKSTPVPFPEITPVRPTQLLSRTRLVPASSSYNDDYIPMAAPPQPKTVSSPRREKLKGIPVRFQEPLVTNMARAAPGAVTH